MPCFKKKISFDDIIHNYKSERGHTKLRISGMVAQWAAITGNRKDNASVSSGLIRQRDNYMKGVTPTLYSKPLGVISRPIWRQKLDVTSPFPLLEAHNWETEGVIRYKQKNKSHLMGGYGSNEFRPLTTTS
ncbi:hypothetical protein CEXT_692891 [Caerostris extrusa]|uniref:Uncharacterized protein n=1 Tax=Caerostris extrusa TaxID=172846 RepID=A0AAV4P526_CAEEX|nr:hypothetical protein CEXT_692891 [Caerostris extrusa]